MEWIRLTEKNKPNDGQWVLVTGECKFNTQKKVSYARYEEFRNEFFTGTKLEEAESFYTTRVRNVTHWMPLPEPYKEDA